MKKCCFYRGSRQFIFAALALLLADGWCHAQIGVTPYHKSGIYRIGETVGWTITVSNGAALPTNNYTYTLKENNLTTIGSGEIDLSSGQGKIETSLKEPGTIYLQITPPRGAQAGGGRGFGGRSGGRGGGLLFGAAVDPLNLQPSVPRPDDFDQFWTGKLADLEKVPVNPVLAPEPTDRTNVEFYKVRLDSLGSHVQGYLAKPPGDGKFPAIVYFQYAGVYALDKNISLDRASQGWLIFDVDSHDIDPGGRGGAPQNYQSVGNTNRETAYFLNMYLRDHRAVDYLTSRPDWNGKVLVAMGISMGGQQSLVTAGLDNRITHVIVEVPSGADFNGERHGRATGYPNWPANNPLAMETGQYFDTVNFASRINATTFLALGFRDTIVAPVGEWIAFNQIKGPKQVAPMVSAGHNNQSSPDEQRMWTEVSNEWLRKLVAGETVTPDTTTAAP